MALICPSCRRNFPSGLDALMDHLKDFSKLSCLFDARVFGVRWSVAQRQKLWEILEAAKKHRQDTFDSCMRRWPGRVPGYEVQGGQPGPSSLCECEEEEEQNNGTGYDRGFDKGFKKGIETGYEKGFNDGYKRGCKDEASCNRQNGSRRSEGRSRPY